MDSVVVIFVGHKVFRKTELTPISDNYDNKLSLHVIFGVSIACSFQAVYI